MFIDALTTCSLVSYMFYYNMFYRVENCFFKFGRKCLSQVLHYVGYGVELLPVASFNVSGV